MKDTQKPIALRSREELTNALLKLMKNKPFREISISEIAENCKFQFTDVFFPKRLTILPEVNEWQDRPELFT